MQTTIPTHLVSTYQLLQCAFPQGIDEQEYLLLLSVLYEEMSERSLAQVIAEFTKKNYHTVLNDVYRVGTTEIFSPTEKILQSIKQKLIHCGYEKWLAES
jgi:hypothetical protein